MFSILESSYAHHYTIKAMFSVSNYFKLFSKKVGFCLQFLSWPTFVIACLSMCYFAILFIRLKLFPKNKKQNMKENMGKGKAPIGLRAKNTKAIYHKSCKKYIFLNPSSIWCKYSCNISELWLLFPLIILRNHPKEFLSFFFFFLYKALSNAFRIGEAYLKFTRFVFFIYIKVAFYFVFFFFFNVP